MKLTKKFIVVMLIITLQTFWPVGSVSYAEDESQTPDSTVPVEEITPEPEPKAPPAENAGDAEEQDSSDKESGKDAIVGEDEPDTEDGTKSEEGDVEELTYDGKGYSVTAASKTGFPEGTKLKVEKLASKDAEYKDLVKDTEKAMAKEGYEKIDYISLYDVSLINDGEEIEPDDTVTVTFSYDEPLDANRDTLSVVHMTEEKPVVMESEVSEDRNEVCFETESFSVYAIVEGVQPPVLPKETISTIDEIDGKDLIIYGQLANTYYAKDGLVTVKGVQCLTRSKNDESEAVLYHFTKVPGTDDQFYIQHAETNEYVRMSNTGGMSFNANSGTAFTVEYFNTGVEGVFYIYIIGKNGDKYCINMKGADAATGGFGGSTYKDDGSKILLKTPAQPMPTDPFELNGKTYGLILYKKGNNEAGSTATAVMGNIKSNTFESKPATIVMDPTGEHEKLFITKETDITEWTFHAMGENNYYITCEVNGSRKYMRLNGTTPSLVDEPDAHCLFKITAGPEDGPFKGKYRLSCGNYVLTLKNGNITDGFNGSAGAALNDVNTWLNLAEPSPIAETDFISYSAKKTSISNPDITTGSKVIVYTRVWNEAEKHYDFYAIDHDGGLIQCYAYGDTIWWKEGRINTLIWDFTEYMYEGTNTPNYYYELQNEYSDKYLAPQIHNGSLLADEPIGITMNGRRYGDYYSKILAWDDPYYDYAGFVVEGQELKTVPMSKAGNFYFAIPEENTEGELTTTKTVDNDNYGISMKMTLYDRSKITANRNTIQSTVLGTGSNGNAYQKIVSTDLGADGYPTSLNTGDTIAPLFEDGQDVNNLFVEHVYRESGYFEYDCTKNFAHLIADTNDPWYGEASPNGGTYQVGDFVLYNQLGSFDTAGLSSQHGQFMPYNDLTENEFSQANSNITDVVNNTLPEYNPRKGEKLFNIPRDEANYFFGMETNANFMQSESGEDQFGHDLVFEFSGDDDMWLYVDGELVLDLGGVHSAYTGTINYKTGVVHMNRRNSASQSGSVITTTLREIFKSNYETRNPDATPQEVQEYLDERFDGNTFKDYSAHSMKMLYMERGAGSSNLYMRFNLTTVEDGQIFVNKKVTGTDKQDYMSLVFPYRIQYYDTDAAMWRDLEQGPDSKYGHVITYYGTSDPVTMAADNKTFYLRAGETVQVHLDSDEVMYRVTECDVNTNIYDVVEGNGDTLTGVHTGSDRYDYTTSDAKASSRKKVIFENHVDPDALRNLSITKRLYDAAGHRVTKAQDPTTFRYRVYLGEDSNGNPEYYRLGSYYVKDEHGNYCRYNPQIAGFESTGIDELEDMTEEQVDSCTFTTSPSGAIDKIPADYTVEIRELLVDAKFMVEERESEIPKGYTFDSYERIAGSYIIEPGDPVNKGTVRDNADPSLEVHNNRGWGITAKKEWTDETFMSSHDTIYMGLYNSQGLVQGTLREYTASTNSLYWYLDRITGDFEDYEVREVVLTNPVVDSDGYVTSYSSIDPLDSGDTLIVSGETASGDTLNNIHYTAAYEPGDPEGAANNIRNDIVDNIAAGVCIIKTDNQGNPITGGSFTLKDEDGHDVGPSTYSAGRNGIITTAQLDDGEYTLTETNAPHGYQKLISSVTFTVANKRITSVSDTTNCTITQSSDTSELRVKNRPAQLQFVKMNEDLTDTIEGAKFALYRELDTPTGAMKDYRPMSGYEELESNANGIIQGLSFDLPPGTYYLEEKAAAAGYMSLGDVKFTINSDTTVTLQSGPAIMDATSNGTARYIIKVKNREYNGVQILKVDEATGQPLVDASFELYKAADFNAVTNLPLDGRLPVAGGTTTANGLISVGRLSNGTYYLVETVVPVGYEEPDGPVKIVVSTDDVTSPGHTVTKIGRTYQVEVGNTPDDDPIIPLPTGVKPVFLAGLALLLAAAFLLRRRADKKSSRKEGASSS